MVIFMAVCSALAAPAPPKDILCYSFVNPPPECKNGHALTISLPSGANAQGLTPPEL